MNKNLIVVDVWPKDSRFEGKRVNSYQDLGILPFVTLSAYPGDIELLIAEYKRTPELFKQEAARSLEAALREWREELYAEDEETRDSANNEEEPPYDPKTD